MNVSRARRARHEESPGAVCEVSMRTHLQQQLPEAARAGTLVSANRWFYVRSFPHFLASTFTDKYTLGKMNADAIS